MVIIVPIYWTQVYKTKEDKTWLVGLNAYRNWHHYTSSKWKLDFHELIDNQVMSNQTFTKYKLHTALYYKNPTCDGANIASLIEKVALDALQGTGTLLQDNVKYHQGTTWEVAGQDKINPRCEVTIIPFKEPE